MEHPCQYARAHRVSVRNAAICLLVSLTVGCTASKPKNSVVTLNPGNVSGMYEGMVPSADSPGRKIVLDLRPDSTATLRVDYGPVEQGRWSSLPPQIRFDFLPVSGRRQESITWTISGEELVPLIWNKDTYGPAGLRLRRRR